MTTIYDLNISQLKHDVETRLSELREKEAEEDLETEIQNHGWALRKEAIQAVYPSLALRLKVRITTSNHVNYRSPEDWHFAYEWPFENIEQAPWTKRIQEWEDLDYDSDDFSRRR